MLDHISFPCPGCRRTLRASVQFVGRSCRCPRCGHAVVVPPRTPAEESAVLVMDDGLRRTSSQASSN
jgi:DNA-directed RNA polymerase subunit RPC12/RpoP